MSGKLALEIIQSVRNQRRNAVSYYFNKGTYYKALDERGKEFVDKYLDLQDAVVTAETGRRDPIATDERFMKQGVTFSTGRGEKPTHIAVPVAYEEVESDENEVSCGSGPEVVAANTSANPQWFWNRAGNAAAVAMELERLQQ